ncbi:MAG TPA: ATP-binding protein [Clostridiales bacterium]|nr:ATP-binding protein [Clostridiales bacterium]
MRQKKSKAAEPTKFRYSIVRKLTSRLFARSLAIFLSFDIMIVMLVCVSLAVYSENTGAKAATALREAQMESGKTVALPEISGVTVSPSLKNADGFEVIRPFSYLLPDITENSSRSITLLPQNRASFLGRLDGLTFHIYYVGGKSTYDIAVALGTFFHYFRICFFILLIMEVFSLFSQAGKNHRLVKKIMNPIDELTAAANSLNQAGNQFDPHLMAAIAGKLAGINATKLDTRIQVDETQEELKNLAFAINNMLDRIDQSYRAQVRFVSDASHELRTPISVIQGYANLLDRWGKNDEKTLQESITAIKDEAANMKDLVEELLFLARGDNNTIQLQLENINLGTLAAEVIHETEMIDSTHHFDVRLHDSQVKADRSLIKQALRILVDNAIKYTNAGGHITVTVESAGDFVKLSVTDDGIGISPEIVPQIFDRFYRADESRTRTTGGAGLGLSIAKWISTRHGGHMEVLSREGIGTKIMIALPVLIEEKLEIAEVEKEEKTRLE